VPVSVIAKTPCAPAELDSSYPTREGIAGGNVADMLK